MYRKYLFYITRVIFWTCRTGILQYTTYGSTADISFVSKRCHCRELQVRWLTCSFLRRGVCKLWSSVKLRLTVPRVSCNITAFAHVYTFVLVAKTVIIYT